MIIHLIMIMTVLKTAKITTMMVMELMTNKKFSTVIQILIFMTMIMMEFPIL